MVADSLLRDGDLALERDYAEGRYAAFHDAPLAPHYRVRGKGGAIYSLHAVGLSILILPAWALARIHGRDRVHGAPRRSRRARGAGVGGRADRQRRGSAEAAGWLAVLSPPLIHYAGLVFTEVPAALALSLGLRLARRDAARGARGHRDRLRRGGDGLAQRALRAARRRGRRPRALAAPSRARAGSACSFRAPCPPRGCSSTTRPSTASGTRAASTGGVPEFSLSTLAEGLPGLLLDQEFGLLVYAPVLVLALPGLRVAVAARPAPRRSPPRGRRRGRADGRHLAHVARRLQPAGALPGADRTAAGGGRGPRLGEARPDRGRGAPRRLDALDRPRGRVGAAPRPSRPRRHGSLLPRAVGRPRVDGSAAGLRARRTPTGIGSRRCGPWPCWPPCRGGRERRARVASRWRAWGWSLAAQAAAAVSHQRTDDRDAVRLVGRSALRVPGLERGPWRSRAGAPSRSAGVRSTSRTATRRAPRSAGDWRSPPGRYRLRLVAAGPGGRARPRCSWRRIPPARPARVAVQPGLGRLGGLARGPARRTGRESAT